MLRPYVEPAPGQGNPAGIPILRDQIEEYEIERIIRHRRVRGRGKGYEYLVLWKGYDLSEAQWLKEPELENASVIL